VISFRASIKREALFLAAANGLGLYLAANAALADSRAPGPAQAIGARSTDMPSERPGATKGSVRKPTRKEPDRSGNFVYEIINNIRARSEELCTRYGSPSDCLEEAELCLTMRDGGDNRVRFCLNTTPGDDASGDSKVQRSRLRR
jgi:hypothetical protein